MYEDFFHFKELPFAVPPDPDFLFLTEKHKKALSKLQYSILNKASITVVSGGIGSGKSTLVRELMQQLENDVEVGLVSNVTISSFEELMQFILYAFELNYKEKDKVELFDVFTNFVIKTYAANKRTVLIIDEAQNLNAEILEQLRMLTNINVDKHQVFQLILIGQPNLWDILRQPRLIQFVQRIEVDYYLGSLDEEETKQYIQHRLSVAGGSRDLFLPDTYSLIWKVTGGVPRLINILCGMALVYAFADQKQEIDRRLIELVLEDKKLDMSPAGDQRRDVYVAKSGLIDNRDQASDKSAKEGKKAKYANRPKRKGLSSIEKLFK